MVHRALEDRVIGLVDHLAGRARHDLGASGETDAAVELGADQREAVGVLCGPGAAVRCVLAPAGFGKTAMVATAAGVAGGAGHGVLGVATTAKAVAELDGAGVASMTIASLRVSLDRDGPLAPGTVIVLDEVSQTSTRAPRPSWPPWRPAPAGSCGSSAIPARASPSWPAASPTTSPRSPRPAGSRRATLVENRRQVPPGPGSAPTAPRRPAG